MALSGNYGGKSEKPLSNDERDQIRRMLMDPLSYPEEFKFWLEHQINQPTPQGRGRWMVYDSVAFNEEQAGTGIVWSGSIGGRCFSPMVPGITRFVGGNLIGWNAGAGEITLNTWTNSFDDKDRQYAPLLADTYCGTFSGWHRGPKVIRNRSLPAASFPGAIYAQTVWLENRDGTGAVKIADLNDAPITGITGGGPFRVNGHPIESLTPNSEGRVFIGVSGGTTDGLFLYDDALGTVVPFVEHAWQGGMYAQQGNNNLYSGPYPLTNLGRGGIGLRVLQEIENFGGTYEIYDFDGVSSDLMDYGASGGQTWQGKFSPDGRWFVYDGALFSPGFHGETWLIDLVNHTQKRLGPDYWGSEFAWSPNSDYIVALGTQFEMQVCSIPDGYIQTIADPVGGNFQIPNWQGNTITAEYDRPSFTEPRQFVEIAPKTGEWVVLDDHGTTLYGMYTYDQTNNTATHQLSPDGRYICYPKCTPTHANFEDFLYVNDVWVTETYGLAGG